MNWSEQIILALNDPHDLQLFSRALTGASLASIAAENIFELEKIMRETSPALVILGQDFANVSELQTAARLLAYDPTLPIVLLLKKESLEDLKQAMQIGVSYCLVAPLQVDELLKAIKNSLQRARTVKEWVRREVKTTTASLQQKVGELKRLETILENIEIGIILLDQENRLLLMNTPAGKTLDLPLDMDPRGKLFEVLLPGQEIKDFLDKAPGSEGLNKELTLANGRVAAISCNPIPALGMAVTVQDITDIKQVDQLRDEFLHTVSHDLRSPLTAIIGYADLLERVGPVNDQQKEFIRRIESSVQNVTSLVNDLLELGRIEAGVDGLMEAIPLEGIIGIELDSFSQEIKEKNIALQLSLPTSLPHVRGNMLRLRQMLSNLIGNAVKYTQAGGGISIEAETNNQDVILRIADNGPGIPPADQPHIFDKFYRASNVDRKVKGTGLGLAIVKSIVESRKGSIRVNSTPGQGTTFVVSLPVFPPTET